MLMKITMLLPEHWEAVKTIYEEGIATGNATFQTTAPSWEEWDAAHSKKPRLVAVENDSVLGWAAITPVSGRCVYAGVGEVSVYVSAAVRGKGVENNCCRHSSRKVKKKIYGPCRLVCFRKMWPASPFTKPAVSVSLVRAKK
eukprot:Opistho-1_new@54542